MAPTALGMLSAIIRNPLVVARSVGFTISIEKAEPMGPAMFMSAPLTRYAELASSSVGDNAINEMKGIETN